ncbi:hypothetical protein B9T31_03700 [Acinetobacter sp. ANC 4558]|uniref:hypothetical protein n=1 Tax=Acinetobacter sp. ANC 4558 TaxID=1977876 RepID=UPI000A331153|nr:hypothetical protein [Acinetobacter sp. ANC 4558]OTG87613.1 hypothetical protein B9T31_03700 [Acinetobacter sp. ANC 4558]
MKKDDFLKQVTSKLNGLAQQHQDKPMIMNNVLEHIHDKKTNRFGLWKMSGFAVAAALAGFIIFPNSSDFTPKTENQVVISPKLSPQMVEDLEMLMILGEDKIPHGS